MLVEVIKFVLQMIGLAVVIWYVWVAQDELRKILREQKENRNGQSPGSG